MVKQITDNETYLLIKYIKSVLWRVGKRLSYMEDAGCLKFNSLILLMNWSPTRSIMWDTERLKTISFKIYYNSILDQLYKF